MNHRMICLLLVGGLAFLTAGCSKKSVQSDGRTSSAARPPIQEPLPNLSLDDPSGTERLSSGIAVAKNDPVTARRLMDEGRAEQAATAAAGLRDVYFGYDSWTISEEGREVLGRNAQWLRTHPGVQLKVEGHCDERGSSTYNFVLAEKRAKVIMNYLTDLGINRGRLAAVSYGKERPFCNDRSESCYQQNRRGHLVVKP
jgi:peptidoglycan-associated lipoprotein